MTQSSSYDEERIEGLIHMYMYFKSEEHFMSISARLKGSQPSPKCCYDLLSAKPIICSVIDEQCIPTAESPTDWGGSLLS